MFYSDEAERAIKRFVVAAMIGIIVVCVGLGVLIGRAAAHSWYPHECCSDRDCWAMGLGEREPIPRYEAGFWVLHDGTRIADGDTRDSPDGLFHVCRHGGQATNGVITVWKGPACLWVPRGAS